jgi:hypothetical protein
MTLLDKNELITGKFAADSETAKKPLPVTTPDQLVQFRQLLAVDEIYEAMLNQTESPDEFYAACSMFAKTLKSYEEAADMFFAAKLGYTYDNIPSKLVYLLIKAKEAHKYPNTAISAIDWSVLKPFLRKDALRPGIKCIDVMNAVFGYSVNLLNAFRARTSNAHVFEYYIKNTDRVLVLPQELATKISSEDDVNSLEYVKNVGVCVRGVPVRTLFNKLGITTDDYNLEGCV